MRSVLGIDAAWTNKNPSGVALAIETKAGWKLTCVESSYERFQCTSAADLSGAPLLSDSAIDVPAILNTCKRRHGRSVDLVAVDMPLSNNPIIARRAADDAVSREYGSRKASTHSPTIHRPGRLSDAMTAAFLCAGYGLQTQGLTLPALIEVYPHPALIELTGADERLKYKYAKCRKYWPYLSPSNRRINLNEQWKNIVSHLEWELEGVSDLLPIPAVSARGAELKAYEDALDAVICAWVGICALTDRAKPFGDADSAIWIPTLSRVPSVPD